MPFSDYDELKAAIVSYSSRPDLLAVEIPDFIFLTEIQAQRDLNLRFIEKEATGNFVAGDDFIALPADLIEPRYLRIETSPEREVEIVSPKEWVKRRVQGAGSSFPTVALHQRLRLMLAPTPQTTDAYELWYTGGIPHLAAPPDDTNWLLENAPDLLLFGSLLQLSMSIDDDAGISKWSAAYAGALRSVRGQEFRARTGGGPLVMRSPYSIPGRISRR